jgi:Fe-S oxidoreductase
MYHDPCELGRHEGIYEAPRRLLKLIPGLKFFEPRFTREEAACCGGGGLLSAFSPTFASLVSVRKLTLEDKVPDNVDSVVTECPQCIVNMRKALELWIDDKEYGITSLAQLMNDSIRG